MLSIKNYLKGIVLYIVMLSVAVISLTILWTLPVKALSQRVFDEAGLLSKQAIESSQANIEKFVNDTQLDTVIVTIDNATGKSSRDYADDFYDYGDFGESGVLLLIDMDNREAYISTKGLGISYFTDARINKILDDVTAYLKAKDYDNAVTVFIDNVYMYYDKGIPDNQYSKEGEFNSSKEFSAGMFILFGSIGALVTILIFVFTVKNRYAAPRGEPIYPLEHYGKVKLSVNNDKVVNRVVTTRKIEKNNDLGKSSTHTSSSGSTHGGGGKSF